MLASRRFLCLFFNFILRLRFYRNGSLSFGVIKNGPGFILRSIQTFLLPDNKRLIFHRHIGIDMTTLVEILFLEEIYLFFELIVLLNQKLVHLHKLLIVVVHCLGRLLLPCVDTLAQLNQNLRVVLNQFPLLGLEHPHQLPHLVYHPVFLLQQSLQLTALLFEKLLKLLHAMGIDISFLLKPGLNSLIDLGGKLFQLQPVLFNFLLHRFLLRKRLLLVFDQLLEERKTIFALLFHSNQYNNRSHQSSLLLENVEEVLHL